MTAHSDFMLGRSDSIWEVSWKLDGEAYDALHALAEEQGYRARANVFQQGDPSDGMYLVLNGYALVIAKDEITGEDRTVGIVTPGQSFGELGLLVQQPRLATVSAGTDLKVLKITPDNLDALESAQPEVASLMYKQLARTLATQLIATGELLRGDQ